MSARLLASELRLSDVRSRGGSMRDLLDAGSALVEGVCYLIDPEEHIIARAVPPGTATAAIPRLARLLAAIGTHGEPPLSAVAAPADAPAEVAGRVLAPVVHEGHLFGYVVLAPGVGTDPAESVWIADRLAAHLRGELIAQRRLARVAWNARANLGRQMIRSTAYDEDLRACAEYLGVDLGADRIVVFVLERGRPSSSTVDPGRLADLMTAHLDTEILPVRGSEGVLLAVKVAPDEERRTFVGAVKSAVVDGLERMGDQHAVAGLSSITPAGRLRRAYREAREVARCLDRYASPDTRAVSSDDLGPARLLVANSDEHAVRLYVHDVLGPLLELGEAGRTLLLTLQAYFEGGRSVRETASTLLVHENTVRHRLSRIHELTGLDAATSSNDQLSLQTALLVLRLQSHHAVPGFGRRAPSPTLRTVRSGG